MAGAERRPAMNRLTSSQSARALLVRASCAFVAQVLAHDQNGTLWVAHPMYTQVVCMKNDWTRLFRFDHGSG